MDGLVERCAGIDVGKKTLTACVRVPDGAGGRAQRTRTFATVTRSLLALRDWLLEQGVTRIGIESTGAYWKPVYYVLEDALECWLLNARHMHDVPGRKTDVKDAEWIAQLVEHGLVRPSFVPPPAIRELRDLTRYRRTIVEERTREAQRLEKLLEDAGIKLSSVASDILGVSGRAMLAALIAGRDDPAELADLARARLRARRPELRLALEGRFGGHHALLAAEMLGRIEQADASIARVTAAIEAAIAPFEAELALLRTIPGVGPRVAEVIVAETGADMARFPSAAHLASWAGLCPGNHESAGRRGSGRTRKGDKWLRGSLVEAAHAASHAKGTYLAAQFWRLQGRKRDKRAALAVAHSILVIAYHVLDRRQPYQDLGTEHLARPQQPNAQARRLVARLERLGLKVTLEPAA